VPSQIRWASPGRAELDEHAEGVHYSEADVDLVRSARSKPEVYADIREHLSVLPVSVAIGQPISHRLDHLQSGIRAQIVLKIFGDDLETLRRLAETVRQQLAAVPGLVIFVGSGAHPAAASDRL
jgi:HME family heavy-metal exporter